MRRVNLGGSDGLEVSQCGMGVMSITAFYGDPIPDEDAIELIHKAVESGCSFFDTAEAYGAGASEEVVGNWLKTRNRRNDIVLATKVAGELTAEWVLASAEESLKRLQVDSVDLFQAHNW